MRIEPVSTLTRTKTARLQYYKRAVFSYLSAGENLVGCITHVPLINFIEILIVGKTNQLGDLIHLIGPPLLKFHRLTDPIVVQKVMEGIAGLCLEFGVQVGAADVQFLAQIGRCV